jgi:bifunctional ADP-heptose synthase (sugar kinase/adenylyltransferase)
VFDRSKLDQERQEPRRQGLRAGFTDRCFDLLHPGHVNFLAKAAEGAELLAALEAVGRVAVFAEGRCRSFFGRKLRIRSSNT